MKEKNLEQVTASTQKNRFQLLNVKNTSIRLILNNWFLFAKFLNFR